MVINDSFLLKLTKEAEKNPRLRKNYDLRNSEADLSQRMLNAIEPGSVMPIHRHPDTSTTVVIIKGSIKQNFYNDEGVLTESVLLSANGKNRIIQIERGRWHNLECLEIGTILFEAKDGAWKPYELLEKKEI